MLYYCHYQHARRFPHGNEFDANGKGQGQVLSQRFDVRINSKPTGRQVYFHTSLTGSHSDCLHLIFLHHKRAELASVDEVDTILDSTAADLSWTGDIR